MMNFNHTCLYYQEKEVQRSRGVTWLWSRHLTLCWLNKTLIVHFDVFQPAKLQYTVDADKQNSSGFEGDKTWCGHSAEIRHAGVVIHLVYPIIGVHLSHFSWSFVMFCRSSQTQKSQSILVMVQKKKSVPITIHYLFKCVCIFLQPLYLHG